MAKASAEKFDQYDVLFASDLESASIFLENGLLSLQGIFLDPSAFNKNALSLIKVCHVKHNCVPLFLINNHQDKWIRDISARPL